MMRKPRPWWISILLPLIIGLTGLSTLMQRPRFALIHTVDVLQLLGSGACFGVAIAVLGFWLRHRGEDRGDRSSD